MFTRIGPRPWWHAIVTREAHTRRVNTHRREDSTRKIAVGQIASRGGGGREKSCCQGERNPKFPLYARTKLAAGGQPLSAWEKVRSAREPLTRLRHCKDFSSYLSLAPVFPFWTPWTVLSKAVENEGCLYQRTGMYQFLPGQFIPSVGAGTIETVTISCRYCYRMFGWPWLETKFSTQPRELRRHLDLFAFRITYVCISYSVDFSKCFALPFLAW